MIKDTIKTRGSSKLFKGSNETAIVTYHEDGITKTAVFRNAGCQDRAEAKTKRLNNVVSIAVSH